MKKEHQNIEDDKWLKRQDEYSYNVSVVVVTYNPSWDKEKETLDSILKQKGINIEIIIADDGSKENNFSLVKEYFENNEFNNYKLVFNPVNKGTVYNTYSGLLAAEGKYIKFISPGDMLYKDDTLKCWFSFMESKSLGWSFSDVIYYKKNNDNIIPIEVNTHPQNIFIYEGGDDNDIRWQYFVLSDIAVGASMLCLRELQLKYCKEILGRVIYAEDNIWRMMMFDGITGGFYNAHTILYEWGSGVSTSNSSIWEARLHNDWINADKILLDRNSIDSFQLKMKKAYDINRGSSKLKKIFIKGKLKNKLFVKKRKSINYLP